MMESEFSYAHYLLSKQRNTMNIERGGLWMKLKNLQPNISEFSESIKPIFPINSRINYWFFSHANCMKRW